MTQLIAFQHLVSTHKRILVTSHVSPDPDAIGSTLLMLELLKHNSSPEHDIRACIEGPITSLYSFLDSFPQLINASLISCIETYKPDLLIMLDGNTFSRFVLSADDADALKNIIISQQIETVCIDHHKDIQADTVTLTLNPESSSTCETVYTLLVKQLGWKLPSYPHPDSSVLAAALLGILADTGTFRFSNPNLKNTFEVVSHIVQQGVSMEYISGKLQTYTMDHIRVMGELMKNMTQTQRYNYSFISDEFNEMFCSTVSDPTTLSYAIKAFTDVHTFLTHIAPHTWGFVVSKHATLPNVYKASFRAEGTQVDTTIFTSRMNGGGHASASGCAIPAQNVQEAIQHIMRIVDENLPE